MHKTEIEGYRKILTAGQPLSIGTCQKILAHLEEAQAMLGDLNAELQSLVRQARGE